MATMVVLVETATLSVSLDAEALGQLDGLGVTNLALAGMNAPSASFSRGGRFEPAASSGAAIAALVGDDGGARAPYPVGQVAVSTVAPHHPKEV